MREKADIQTKLISAKREDLLHLFFEAQIWIRGYLMQLTEFPLVILDPFFVFLAFGDIVSDSDTVGRLGTVLPGFRWFEPEIEDPLLRVGSDFTHDTFGLSVCCLPNGVSDPLGL